MMSGTPSILFAPRTLPWEIPEPHGRWSAVVLCVLIAVVLLGFFSFWKYRKDPESWREHLPEELNKAEEAKHAGPENDDAVG